MDIYFILFYFILFYFILYYILFYFIFIFNDCVAESLGTWFPKFQRELLPSCPLTVGSTRMDHTSLEDDITCLRNAEDYLINDIATYLRRPESSGTQLWIAASLLWRLFH